MMTIYTTTYSDRMVSVGANLTGGITYFGSKETDE